MATSFRVYDASNSRRIHSMRFEFGSIILFLPTTFTHTHDPRPLPTTHDPRHLATLVSLSLIVLVRLSRKIQSAFQVEEKGPQSNGMW